jgi:hypothetical protein
MVDEGTMSDIAMPLLFTLLCLLFTVGSLPAQVDSTPESERAILGGLGALGQPSGSDQTPAILQVVVLEIGEQKYTAGDVLNAIEEYDASLPKTVRKDSSYAQLYFSSMRFLYQVRSFGDRLALDSLGVPKVSQDALELEAKAWAADRSRSISLAGALAANGLEIEVRARLLARQNPSVSTTELRQHLMRSVPEFFGVLQCSWIRLPLFDRKNNQGISPKEIRKRYDILDQVGVMLAEEKISWEAAVEKYCQDPVSSKRQGAIGLVERTQTDRFEEPLLRAIFADLGATRPTGKLLRGPIIGKQWVYLVRIDALRVDGAVELGLVQDRVLRSLRETNLAAALAGIRKVRPAKITAPIFPKP